jgi:hypothetical protein
MCLLLLVSLFFSSILHSGAGASSALNSHAQAMEIQAGHGDTPCSPAAPGCDHKAHLNCVSGSGCHFAAVMPESLALVADAKLALLPRQASFLHYGALTPLFRPPRSSAQA